MDERSFYAGVCMALAIVADHDEATLWGEIIQSLGNEDEQRKLLRHARRHGQWEIGGFKRYYKTELSVERAGL